LAICLEESNCESFETWGISDKYSSQKEPQNALPFDINMDPKISYTYMLATLNEFNSTMKANAAMTKA